MFCNCNNNNADYFILNIDGQQTISLHFQSTNTVMKLQPSNIQNKIIVNLEVILYLLIVMLNMNYRKITHEAIKITHLKLNSNFSSFGTKTAQLSLSLRQMYILL